MSFYLCLTSPSGSATTERYTTNLTPSIQLDRDKNYEVAIVSGSIPYSIFTISSILANNTLKYTANSGGLWKTVTFPDGNYDIFLANQYFQEIMRQNGDYVVGGTGLDDDEFYIYLEVSYATGKVQVRITSATYGIDFDTMTIFFGATVTSVFNGVQTTLLDTIPDVNSGFLNFLIRTDLTNSSFINSSQSDALFSITPNLPPFYILSLDINERLYLPLARKDRIDSVLIYISDQDNVNRSLNSQPVSVTLHIREQTR